jgi:hypothetical protein
MKTNSNKIILTFIILLLVACTDKSGKQKKIETDKNVANKNIELLPNMENYLEDIKKSFEQIPEERKTQLKKISLFIKTKKSSNETSKLVFICTHNSRRSQMGQLWAQAAAYHYGIENVLCFSGGTETTAFNIRAVRALRKAGFNIEQVDTTSNPVFLVKFTSSTEPIKTFSKKYNDSFNPHENFVAIMTCSAADKTCPNVEGATLRVSIPYEDPKEADNTPQEEAQYDERCRQIAVEMFYIFSLI